MIHTDDKLAEPLSVIGKRLALKLAQAVCGDDHLMCTWPTCHCKVTKQKINAVALVVGEHIGKLERGVNDALSITGATHE